MKFYADDVPLRCGECGASTYTRRGVEAHQLTARCLNRECVASGKLFVVALPALEGEEVKREPVTADDVDQEAESAQSVARRYRQDDR